MTDPTLKTCTFAQLKTRIIYAIKANDRQKIADLTAETKRRITEAGHVAPEGLTDNPEKLAALRAQRAAILAS